MDACQFFYECEGCGAILKPLAGDCCVFCSYGSVPCPPIQEARENSALASCCGAKVNAPERSRAAAKGRSSSILERVVHVAAKRSEVVEPSYEQLAGDDDRDKN